MSTSTLSCSTLKALPFPHFPSRVHAFIWRNWELVPTDRIAEVLKTTIGKVENIAGQMGLEVPINADPLWLARGYITIIRNNWHLIPFEQLIELLGWNVEQMAYTLKEDDFLGHKLGPKPMVEPLLLGRITAEDAESCCKIKEIVKRHTGDLTVQEKPFEFLDKFIHTEASETHSPETLQAETTVGRIDSDNADDFVLAYSYAAVYGDALLDPDLDPYPDGVLERFANLGVNAIWLQGILYTLVPWSIAPELSEGWQLRLSGLRSLCERAADFGIQVYLYMNEPRGMGKEFFERHPDLKGAPNRSGDIFSMCTSRPEVIEWLKDGTEQLFREVPQLAGLFTITASENPTSCHSHGNHLNCPLCSTRQTPEVIAEVNGAIAAGAHRSKPDAMVIAWTWAWSDEWAEKAIDLLPDNVALMCTSERELDTMVGGIAGQISDYSISKIGPGPYAVKWWKHARKRGLKTYAKMQLNNTWECSAVPYIPVPFLVEEHLNKVREQNVNGLMISWTTGGYPGGNLSLLKGDTSTLAVTHFGPEAAPFILDAWQQFSDAFREFPLHRTNQLYCAPQNYGPVALMYKEKTGFSATMIGFPYDDLNGWRGSHYPEEIFEEQFRKISEGWQRGLQSLKQGGDLVPDELKDNYIELESVAIAFFTHYRSTYNQIRFVRTRDAADSDIARLNLILDDEIETTKTLIRVVATDSRIGFEASNHYYYTINTLKEKILNCEYLKQKFQK